jgi:hypothetical protein
MALSRASIRRHEAFTSTSYGTVFATEYGFTAEVYSSFRAFQTGGADPIRSRDGFTTALAARDYLRPSCRDIGGAY